MNSLNQKLKIIAVILASIIIGCACYYIYNKNANIEIIENADINIENQEINEEFTTDNENEKTEEKILIHISGAVNKEGIIELSNDSRIADAIEKAGGLKDDANIKDINLAYKLEDGMKIYIPNNTEQEEKKKNNDINNEIIMDNTNEYITISGENEKADNNNVKNTKININTATQTELETLPGIGPSTALKIINYRKENGKFKNIEDIKEVSGIGEAKFENIRNLIIV